MKISFYLAWPDGYNASVLIAADSPQDLVPVLLHESGWRVRELLGRLSSRARIAALEPALITLSAACGFDLEIQRRSSRALPNLALMSN